MAERLVISIDAMGGDNAHDAIIEGVKIASDKNPEVFFLLFGNEDEISKLQKQFEYAKNHDDIGLICTGIMAIYDNDGTRSEFIY